jgi:hypothetical protein
MTLWNRFSWAACASSCLVLGCAPGPALTAEGERQIAIAHAAAETRHVQHVPSVDLFNKTVDNVEEYYFDHSRIRPRMIGHAMVRALGTVAPQVRIDEQDADTVRISSGDQSRTLDLRHLESLRMVAVLFKDLHAYLTGPLGVDDSSRDLGFAATNGMLATLDPGCVLMTPEEHAVRSAAGVDERKRIFFWTLLGAEVGYVRAHGLFANASTLTERAVKEFRAETGKGSKLRGIVLDLRGNYSGSSQEIIRVAKVFDSGLAVTIRNGPAVMTSPGPRGRQASYTGRLAILVDQGTASGAEVVAAVLKDRDRAVVLGRRTAGAGTLQVLLEYAETDPSGKAYLMLTVATVARLSGARIEGVGLMPDVLLVPMTEDGRSPMSLPPSDLSRPWNPFATDRGPLGPATETPVVEVPYRWQPPRERPKLDEQVLEDFEIRVARDLLLRASGTRRSEIVSELENLVKQTPPPETAPNR